MIDPSQITEHLEVVGSDGQHVGTVDKLAIKLTKKDPAAQGHHHIINLDLVASVDGGKVTLNVPASEAAQDEKALADSLLSGEAGRSVLSIEHRQTAPVPARAVHLRTRLKRPVAETAPASRAPSCGRRPRARTHRPGVRPASGRCAIRRTGGFRRC